MIDITTSKTPIRCYIEAGDGAGAGAVVCYLKEVAPNEWVAHREWFSDVSQAKTLFSSLDVAQVEEKATIIEAKIAEPIKTGKG
jgi:hypothetical protein